MDQHVNNKYKQNSRFYISYEVGVMLSVIENSMAHSDLCDSVERICKNVKLNVYMVSDGFIHYCKDNFIKYDIDDINEIFKRYGLEGI